MGPTVTIMRGGSAFFGWSGTFLFIARSLRIVVRNVCFRSNLSYSLLVEGAVSKDWPRTTFVQPNPWQNQAEAVSLRGRRTHYDWTSCCKPVSGGADRSVVKAPWILFFLLLVLPQYAQSFLKERTEALEESSPVSLSFGQVLQYFGHKLR